MTRRTLESSGAAPARVERCEFGALPDGRTVDLFTLSAGRVSARIMTYGGVIVSLHAPARDGAVGDIVLGYDALGGYLADSPYFGAIVGRHANRIAQGKFTLDGVTYQLACNDGVNHLHGGMRGFDKVLWRAESGVSREEAWLALAYDSPHGDEGYPGALSVLVTYTVGADDALRVTYEARSDRATVVNLTQHSYFDLSCGAAPDVLAHEVTVFADRYLPVDDTLIPTGESAPVAGTPFDFTRATPIGSRIHAAHEQLSKAGGYDHCFVLREGADEGTGDDALRRVHSAHVREPLSGRTIDVFTSEPGMQLYSGNFLDGSITGKAGHRYEHRTGFCLETQHFPDSPNHPSFPEVVLHPGERYRSETSYVFGIDTR